MAIRPDAVEYLNKIFSKGGFLQPGNTIKTGSVADYYEEVGGGRVSVTGDIFGPCVLPGNVSDYCQDSHGKGNSPSDLILSFHKLYARPACLFEEYFLDVIKLILLELRVFRVDTLWLFPWVSRV